MPSDRAQALAQLLTDAGYPCERSFEVVTIVGPEYLARVSLGADVDGYLCSFASTCKGNTLAWAAWTLAVRELVASLWAEVESYAIPASAPPKPAAIVRPVYVHAYPLNVSVDAGLADAYSAVMLEARLVIVREWRAWGGVDSLEREAPRVSWLDWGRATAGALGVAKGWASLPTEIESSHPAMSHVRRVLIEQAQHGPPNGIVALDLRGLPAPLVEVVARELVTAASLRLELEGWTRGGVLLCEGHAAMHVLRAVELTA